MDPDKSVINTEENPTSKTVTPKEDGDMWDDNL
jgi:hypothetical protein